ncbi:pirin family protein [Methylosinus sp. Sm6]|uniref:pirin family protein n=1 Tax=Methylosinus sp. Sm6 TaxID=2866948 RepID=UPI001C99E7A7|nr:pirin family protein [Methylosinus sp. Sm6]MBY6239768.1 pirin family protein [Methylosinus sp. Sm6]
MRKILGVYSAPRAHWVGDGFPVRSLISPHAFGEPISPFLLLDHAGPHVFAPATTPRGVGPHPHRGFETVTIVYSGEVEHRDSTGAGGVIGPGDVQWMTAAAGVLHDEFHSRAFTAAGGAMEMAQLWINLPAAHKKAAPHYQAIRAEDIPTVELPNGAGALRVIAGRYDGRDGPARSYTPLDVWDLRLTAGGHVELVLPEGHTLAVVVLAGAIEIGGAATARDDEVVLLDRTGGGVSLAAATDAKALILSGAPLGEPVAAHGPFVMNTQEELRQAFADFESGGFGRMPA